MRHRVIQFGFAVIGASVGALACAGSDDTDPTPVFPTDSSGATASGTSMGTNVAPSSTTPATTSANSSSAGGVGTSTGSTSSAGETSSAVPQGPTFTADIHPLFVASCTGTGLCHGDGESFTKIASASVDTAFDAIQGVVISEGRTPAQQVSHRVNIGDMPMSQEFTYQCRDSGGMHDTTKPECLTATEVALLQDWADAGGAK